MDDLAFVRARIESYADYTNDDHRRLADEQIRAYVGEALARIFERLQPSGATAEALSRVLLRCQFADQAMIRAFDTDDVNANEMTDLHAIDRALVDLADHADAVTAGGLAAFVAQVDAALGRRTLFVLGAASPPPGPPAR